jgi:hypothetical protein
VGADGLVHDGEAVGGEGVLAGECGEQHLVAGLQAAAAAQRGRNGDVGLGGHGDHAAGVAARGDHPRLGGQGQPVAVGPAQSGDYGPLADPARGVDAGEPVHDVLWNRPHRAC